MGFDAIWISPIVKNTPGGYHGYWAEDFNEINPYFGSKEDLKSLVNSAHNRSMFVMVDVVANHVGPVSDFTSIIPFNESDHYHNCANCPQDCTIQDYNNQVQTEFCRLAGLPDLNQTNPFVRNYLIQWINDTVREYNFDGLRVDTVPEIDKDFWTEFSAAAGVFGMGEVFNGNTQYVASYEGPVTTVLSYPLYFKLRSIFVEKTSFYGLEALLQEYERTFHDQSILGNFIDNHDRPRFLFDQTDKTQYKNALAYTVMAQGIPIIYYGTEQGFSGGELEINLKINSLKFCKLRS